MRAILAIVLLLVVAGGVVFGLTRPGSDGPPRYRVVLDNAFGLEAGTDLKVAGVRAGKIKKLEVDRRTHKAIVDFQIDKAGFGSLRKDVFCESRPQSLIGEYYIDCEPGTAREKLPDGATIPVERTASTIPLDLVNNVLRRPYRERLAIILNELGAGVAGRAEDIDDVIRRASPALRETEKVLTKLGDQNRILQQLVTDGDTTMGDLADNKEDVGRWVKETEETAAASAERRADIEAGLQRLPTFLRELRPTMAALGDASEAQTPALQNLRASAGELATFLENLKPLAESTQVNLRSLAEASRKGRPAIRAARPVVAELSRATRGAKEAATNAGIITTHLHDRKFAVEKDPRSPGGQGYTGFEAVLQWVFDQSQAINIYDKNGYILKVNLFHSKCSNYQNPKTLKEEMEKDPGFYKDCAAILGPNQPGITTPDPTSTGNQFGGGLHQASSGGGQSGRREGGGGGGGGGGGDRGSEPTREIQDRVQDLRRRLGEDELRKRAIARLRRALRDGEDNVGRLRKRLQERFDVELPRLDRLRERVPAPPAPSVPRPTFPAPQAPAPSAPNGGGGATDQLLDYLFAP